MEVLNERRDQFDNASIYDSMLEHMRSIAPPGFVIKQRHKVAAFVFGAAVVFAIAYLLFILFVPIFKSDTPGGDPVAAIDLRSVPDMDPVCPGGHHLVDGQCMVYAGHYRDHNGRRGPPEPEPSFAMFHDHVPETSQDIMGGKPKHVAASRMRSLSEVVEIHAGRGREPKMGVREWTCKNWPEGAGARYKAVGNAGEAGRYSAAWRSIERGMASRQYQRAARRGATGNTLGIGFSMMHQCERALITKAPECTGVNAWKFMLDILCEPFPEDIWDVYHSLGSPGNDSANAQRDFEYGFALATLDANGINAIADMRSKAMPYDARDLLAIMVWSPGHLVRQHRHTSSPVLEGYFARVFDALEVLHEHFPDDIVLPSMRRHEFGAWMVGHIRTLEAAAKPGMDSLPTTHTYQFMRNGMHNETYTWDELEGHAGMSKAVMAGFKAGWGRAFQFEAEYLESHDVGMPQLSHLKHWVHNDAYFTALHTLMTSLSRAEMHRFIMACVMADTLQYTTAIVNEADWEFVHSHSIARSMAVANSGPLAAGAPRDQAHDHWVVARHGLPTVPVMTEAEALKRKYQLQSGVGARWKVPENCTVPDEYDSGLTTPHPTDYRFVEHYHMHSVRLEWVDSHCRWLASQSLPPLSEELHVRAAMVGAYRDALDGREIREYAAPHHVHGIDARAGGEEDPLAELEWDVAMNPPGKTPFADASHAEQMYRMRRFNTALMHAEHHRHNRGERAEGEHAHGIYHTTEPGVRSKERDPISRAAFFPTGFHHAAATAAAYRHIIVAVHDGNATAAAAATTEFIDALVKSRESPEMITYELEAVAALFCGTKSSDPAAHVVYEVLASYEAPNADSGEKSLWYRLHGKAE